MAKCPSKYEASQASPGLRRASIHGHTRFVSPAAAFVVVRPTRSPRPSRARGGDRARLVESGIGAFYFVTALMTVRRR